MTVSTLEKSVEEEVPMQPNDEPDLDKWINEYKFFSNLNTSMIRIQNKG